MSSQTGETRERGGALITGVRVVKRVHFLVMPFQIILVLGLKGATLNRALVQFPWHLLMYSLFMQ
jgi:hypothetical protein